MNKSIWKRCVSMALALILVLCAAPVTAMAAQSRSTLIPLEATDVELDSAAFQYTGQEIRPNVTVRVQDSLLTLDKDYTLEYADNIEIGTASVIVTGIASGSVGYTGTVEIPFEITKEAPAFTLIPLKSTDVTMDGTEFTYTGSPIEPGITVTVEGTTLTAGKDYSLSYRNNVEPGTATVTVSGIATASETLGYTGTVEIDFTITPAAAAPVALQDSHVTIEGTSFTYTGSYIEPKVTVTVNGSELIRDEHYTLRYHSNIGVGSATASVTGIESAGYTGQVNVTFTIEKDPETPAFQLIQLQDSDVAIDGTEFPYTGKAVEPAVTVTVNGRELVQGQDYSLTYENNIQPGTAQVIVRGIATASETLGYTGEVTLPFTIVQDQEETESTEPGEVTYKITQGDKSTWYQESTKTLTFVADGDFDSFQSVKIDGKNLPEKYYTAKSGSTVITLTNAFLQKLSTGEHTITILFEDGEAEATFLVAEGLDTSNPETGDSFNPGLWIGLMCASAAGGIGLFVFRKKIFD